MRIRTKPNEEGTHLSTFSSIEVLTDSGEKFPADIAAIDVRIRPDDVVQAKLIVFPTWLDVDVLKEHVSVSVRGPKMCEVTAAKIADRVIQEIDRLLLVSLSAIADSVDKSLDQLKKNIAAAIMEDPGDGP